MISFLCPGCQRRLKVKDTAAGRQSRCPGCGAAVHVPSVEAHVPEAEQATIAPVKGPATASGADREAPTLAGSVPVAAERTHVVVGGTELPAGLLAPPQAADEIGRLGSYRILKVLGAGGMGMVLQGEDTQLHRSVALKVMLASMAANPDSRERFLREARAAAALEHDHIVAIYHVGEDRGVPYLVMPLLKGESLDGRLRREGRLSVRDVLRIGREAAKGLAAAHERGLVHRDIKPGNIWLESPRGRVKILDFGLARNTGSGHAALTQQGAIVGTPAYMAPEQASGGRLDARTDLFSLGCVLYHMSTSKPPFGGSDMISTLMAVATQDPAPPRASVPELPQRLNDLILKLLAKDPAGRPATARAVAEELRAIERGEVGATPRPTRRLVRAGVVAALLAIVVIAALALRGSRKEEPKEIVSATPDAPPTPPAPIVAPDHTTKKVSAYGTALSSKALVPRPAAVAGLSGWTIETVGHRGRVWSAAYSPDGHWLATGGADGTLRLWQTATGKLRALLGHAGPVHSVAWFAHSGTVKVATGGGDGIICIWDPTAGRLLRRLEGAPGPVTHIAWQDNRHIASYAEQVLRIWDAENGNAVGPDRPVTGTNPELPSAWSPDGKKLAVAAEDHTLQVWDAWSGQKTSTFSPAPERITALTWSADGQMVAAASRDGQVRIWDQATGKAHPEVMHFDSKDYPPTALGWGPGGRTLVAAGVGRRVQLWEARTGKPSRALFKPTGAVYAIAWNPDRKTFAAAGLPGNVYVWHGNNSRPAVTLEACDPGADIPHLAFSPDALALGLGHANGRVLLWDLAGGQFQQILGASTRGLRSTCLAWSPDGKQLAMQSADGGVILCDAQSGEVRTSLAGHKRPLGAIGWSPDGRMVMTTGVDADHTTQLYAAGTGKLLHTLPSTGRVAWSPDSTTLAMSSSTGVLQLWDAGSGQQSGSLAGHVRKSGAVAWSGGGIIAAAGVEHPLLLWDAARRQLLRSPTDHTANVIGLCWRSEDQLLSHAQNGKVRIWDVRQGKEVQALRGLPGRGVLSPDGRYLAESLNAHAWAGTGTRVWELEQGNPVMTLLVLRSEPTVAWLALSSQGDYRGSTSLENQIVVVAQTEDGQQTLAPDEFAARFGWKNDPSNIRLPTH